ncbi:MAG: hypothetical protein PHH57_08035 [Candidatus Omnitrophica bacterium]|nr:hypothetical protein [Methanocellales archaeon]MDD5501606.1 hypothetical protein [Candidatus Omnitrophota bacterium]
MVVAIVIVLVFLLGLAAFASKLPEIKAAAKDGWDEGSGKKK